MSRRVIALTALAMVVVVIISARIGASTPDDTATTSVATATAKAERRDLVHVTELVGETAPGSSSAQALQRAGTITQLADVGTVLDRGSILARVDDRPVAVMLGPTPTWRRLAKGEPDGVDIEQLETNLQAMGHLSGRGVPDRNFNDATEVAVKRWQKERGVDQTGVIELGDVVFLPQPMRVEAQTARVGANAAPGVGVVELADVTPAVEVALSNGNTLDAGASVVVSLEGKDHPAKVVRVDKAAQGGGAGGPGGSRSGADATAIVAFDDPSQVTTGSGKHVTVRHERVLASGVVAVPVTAVLGVPGGGFVIEVLEPGGGPSRRVPVELGDFAQGYVEVRGEVEAGDDVVVPA